MTEEKNEETTLATEIISELKAQNKRNFILIILLVILEAATIAWFTLPTEEVEEVTLDSADDGNASYFSGDSNKIGGDFINGKNYSQDHEEETAEQASKED